MQRISEKIIGQISINFKPFNVKNIFLVGNICKIYYGTERLYIFDYNHDFN